MIIVEIERAFAPGQDSVPILSGFRQANQAQICGEVSRLEFQGLLVFLECLAVLPERLIEKSQGTAVLRNQGTPLGQLTRLPQGFLISPLEKETPDPIDTRPVSQRAIRENFFELLRGLAGHSFLDPRESESESRCGMIGAQVQHRCESIFSFRNRRASEIEETE